MAETQTVVDLAAPVLHEANRAICEALGDNSQVPWPEVTEEFKQSSRDSADILIDRFKNGETPQPSESHDWWYKERVAAGWVYGPVKNAEKRTNPALVPYSDLSPEQKVKDYLQIAIAKAFFDAGF